MVGIDGARRVGIDGVRMVGIDGARRVGIDGVRRVGIDGVRMVGIDGARMVGIDGARTVGIDGRSLRRGHDPISRGCRGRDCGAGGGVVSEPTRTESTPETNSARIIADAVASMMIIADAVASMMIIADAVASMMSKPLDVPKPEVVEVAASGSALFTIETPMGKFRVEVTTL